MRHPGIGFTHLFPGVVDTPAFATHWTLRLIRPLISLFAISPKDSAEWMLRPLLDSSFADGAFHLDPYMDPVPAKKLYLTPESQQAVFAHLSETVAPY